MLNFFLLEKAFYEIEYDWHIGRMAGVPLTGMLRILALQPHEAA